MGVHVIMCTVLQVFTCIDRSYTVGFDPDMCMYGTGNGYLCSVRPSVYAQHFEEHLPESIKGIDFLTKYHHHYDQATQVSHRVPPCMQFCSGGQTESCNRSRHSYIVHPAFVPLQLISTACNHQ